MKRFGEYVRDARKAKGWTLDRLAWEIRSHKGYVSGIETGKVPPPSAKVVEKLCRKLDLPDPDDMQALAYLEKRPDEVRLDSLIVIADRLAKAAAPVAAAS